RNEHARDLLTIFSEKCRVKFVYPDERSEVLTGRWCKICKVDEEYIRKHGKQKAFHIGSNSSC
ncbi:hypothetical protein SCLCIDRAFT_89710, partial [Scleroderma citrinum Foug A]